MDWIKQYHVDTVVVLSGILASVFWMNGKFNEVDREMHEIRVAVNTIQTVLIVKQIMPGVLAANEGI